MEDSPIGAVGGHASSVSEFNNNQLNWKGINPVKVTLHNDTIIPNNSHTSAIGATSCCESSDFQIININPCYVKSISSYQYETFKMATATVTPRPYEKGRLAQMKANTKMKRSRKPYQLPPRSATSNNAYHSRAGSMSMKGDDKPMTCSNYGKNGLNRSQSNRVVYLFDDRPTLPKPPCDITRSRSLEDLKLLAKNTTVCFDSDDAKQENEELEQVSHGLSNLHVT